MRLADTLTGPERAELQNVMRHEPVFPGDTISHHTANSLAARGLIRKTRAGWMVNWGVIKVWPRGDDSLGDLCSELGEQNQ